MTNRLAKSPTDRMIAGVCGGLGEYFDIDPVLVRLIFVLLAFTGVGVLAYITLWIVMPERSSLNMPPREFIRDNLGRIRGDVNTARGTPGETAEGTANREAGTDLARAGERLEADPVRPAPRDRRALAGWLLVIVGAIMLIDRLSISPWLNFGRLWPVLLILLGGYMVYNHMNRNRV